jgi:hypothetical protein
LSDTPDNHSRATSPGGLDSGGAPGEVYEPPALTWLGSLADLTQGGAGSYSDGGSFQDGGGGGSII